MDTILLTKIQKEIFTNHLLSQIDSKKLKSPLFYLGLAFSFLYFSSKNIFSSI